MSNDIFVLIEHRDGVVAETSFELIGKAKELAGESGGAAVAVILGDGAATLTGKLGAADRAIVIDGPGVAQFTPTGYTAALKPVLGEHEPLLMLFPNSAVGMDVAAGLSQAADLPLAAYAVDLKLADGQPVVTSQVYGGKINAEMKFTKGRGIVTVIAGSFPADAGQQDGSPEIQSVATDASDSRVRFKKLIAPEAGDVDITKESVLVSVGRGVEEEDNIELAQELADALGGAVSASRPVVDAGWLPKTRQVGKSGLKVKPKLYLAVGISGAPEHLEGMRDAELIIAVNSDENAPIFSVAHYGVVGDLFDLLPSLTEKIQERVG
ncbi:MAG: electron transfer flavoprotein subunit alpha/FixB family protein [Gemmatimonadota bacterium]|nr:electron transfer flavoprotein subunit alpha/FixB family protein [Gemmatimonadota bacterium]